tara:strand:+ start:1554 stop:1973 length:420 start_codon:yes stop_codon:yes gene_type:complete
MKGIIYKLIDLDTNEIYIGSTKRNMKTRINQHRGQTCCKAHEMVRRDNYKIRILEEIDFIDEIELKKCEQKHMDLTENLINRNRAFGSGNDKEYYKNYYQQNKEKYKKKKSGKEIYTWRKTWGEPNGHNLININMNFFD